MNTAKQNYNKIKNPKVSPLMVSFGFLSFGGDGGNRNHVQNHLTKGSTSVACLLGFPSANGGKQPLACGILYYLMKAEKLNHSCSPLSRCPYQSRGTL